MALEVNGSKWTVLEWDDEGAQFLQSVEQQPSKERDEPPIVVKDPEQERAQSVDVTDNFTHQYSPSNSVSSAVMELHTNPNEQKPPDLIDTVVDVGSEKWIAAKKRLENQRTIYFTDTGGQFEFQEVLPAIISGPSIFLLVFMLQKN